MIDSQDDFEISIGTIYRMGDNGRMGEAGKYVELRNNRLAFGTVLRMSPKVAEWLGRALPEAADVARSGG